LKHFDDSILASWQAADVFERLGDQKREADARHNLAFALHSTERLDEAIVQMRRSATLYESVGTGLDEGQSLSHLAVILGKAGQYAESVAVGRRAIEIFAAGCELEGQGVAFYNMGHALRLTGSFDETVAAYREAADIFHQVGDILLESHALSGFMSAEDVIGKSDQSDLKPADSGFIIGSGYRVSTDAMPGSVDESPEPQS
jgi:tetratricopeptide (TPR) repeat protein